jgi:hypothetical protein
MSAISSVFGNPPGLSSVVETYEAAITFGIQAQLKFWNAYIASTAADPGNTNSTWRLRQGLVMGIITSSGQWTNYVATNTDGSEVAAGILAYGMRMQDVFTGLNTNKFYAMCVGGNVQVANLIGLDNQAQAQLSNRFTFDTNLMGFDRFPVMHFQTKTANYQIVASDNLSEFNNLGATGEVDFTLPPIANGYSFTFYGAAAQILKVISTEGGNIVALNSLTSTSVAFGTGGQQEGAAIMVYSNPAATKWYVRNISGVTLTLA